MTKELLNKRKQIKKRKPTYRRVQSNQYAKLRNDPKWRRPRGMGNKDRKNKKGHTGTLRVGYGSPKAIRGANNQGLWEVLVHNVADVKAIDSKTQAAVIGRSVGGKKKLDILQAGKEQKITFSNINDIDKAIESLKKPEKKTTSKKAKTASSTGSKTSSENSESGSGSKESQVENTASGSGSKGSSNTSNSKESQESSSGNKASSESQKGGGEK